MSSEFGITGIGRLWEQSLGDPRIRVAVLDGPADLSHPSLSAARFIVPTAFTPSCDLSGPAAEHGTLVTSALFGRHDGPVPGVAPRCTGMLLPIFTDGPGRSMAPCSQMDLARAILTAAERGAHVINISGGEFSPSGEPHPLLADAVRYCLSRRVLIVAAAGNDGCECVHVPGAIPSVLVVGAMDRRGTPLDYSNWGMGYRNHGVLAIGEGILGAVPGNGVASFGGTSAATVVVSGIVALLLAIELRSGRKPDPHRVRNVLLSSADRCDHKTVPDCRRMLAGRVNVGGALTMLLEGGETVSSIIEPVASPRSNKEEGGAVLAKDSAGVRAASVVTDAPESAPELDPSSEVHDGAGDRVFMSSATKRAEGVAGSQCGCACSSPSAALVYALGRLGFDFGTEARRDSIAQHMGSGKNPYDPGQLLDYLKKNRWDTLSILWTLQLDSIPLYCIQPSGPFGADVCERLCEFLHEQVSHDVERVSIPGRIVGQARLITGQVVPVIQPELRGMCSWSTAELVAACCGSAPGKSAPAREREAFEQKSVGVKNFLDRVYYEVRNFGLTPQDRAINYAATNAFNIEKAYEEAIKEDMDLDSIDVERSPVCRPDSDCWDVKLFFFFPKRETQTVRRVYRFTVDVSDIVPVVVGDVRSWYVR